MDVMWFVFMLTYHPLLSSLQTYDGQCSAVFKMNHCDGDLWEWWFEKVSSPLCFCADPHQAFFLWFGLNSSFEFGSDQASSPSECTSCVNKHWRLTGAQGPSLTDPSFVHEKNRWWNSSPFSGFFFRGFYSFSLWENIWHEKLYGTVAFRGESTCATCVFLLYCCVSWHPEEDCRAELLATE